MANDYFQFKQFRIEQEHCGMKVTTEACLFGAFAVVNLPPKGERILDIGTGTGVLSLMLAQKSSAKINALEIDREAYLQAESNFENSPWRAQLSVRHSDLANFQTNDPYDLVICNPPFFRNNQLGLKSNKNQALHNFSLDFEKLTRGIKRNIKPQTGIAIVLYPEYEMALFTEIMAKHGLHSAINLDVYNQANKPIFRQIRIFLQQENHSTKQKTIIIKEQDGQYSDEFMELLKDYYLHL